MSDLAKRICEHPRFQEATQKLRGVIPTLQWEAVEARPQMVIFRASNSRFDPPPTMDQSDRVVFSPDAHEKIQLKRVFFAAGGDEAQSTLRTAFLQDGTLQPGPVPGWPKLDEDAQLLDHLMAGCYTECFHALQQLRERDEVKKNMSYGPALDVQALRRTTESALQQQVEEARRKQEEETRLRAAQAIGTIPARCMKAAVQGIKYVDVYTLTYCRIDGNGMYVMGDVDRRVYDWCLAQPGVTVRINRSPRHPRCDEPPETLSIYIEW